VLDLWCEDNGKGMDRRTFALAKRWLSTKSWRKLFIEAMIKSNQIHDDLFAN